MSGFWRKCRIAFRCARFTVWGMLLLLLGAFAWVNLVGLPPFLKTRLVTALHQRGVDLEFSRMRLRVVHGLICDNVRIGAAETADGPVLTAREVQLQVNFPALLHLRAQVDGFVLHQGEFRLPLAGGDSLSLTNIEGVLRILPDDTWSLDQLRADFVGVTLSLGGEIVHAPEGRNWKIFANAKAPDRGSVQSSLQGFSETLKQIHFQGRPVINARLDGDARDVHSFTFRFNAQAPEVHTPWFSAHNLEFVARVTAPTNAPLAVDPAWGLWTNLQPFHVEWLARGSDIEAARITADSLDCSVVWNAPELAVSKLAIRLGGGSFDANAKLNVASRRLEFRMNSGFDLHVLAPIIPPPVRTQLADISWTAPPQIHTEGSLVFPPWSEQPALDEALLAGLRLQGSLALTNTQIGRAVRLDYARSRFRYSGRTWKLSDLAVAEGATRLEAGGEVSDLTRDFRVKAGGKFDTENLHPFLTSSNAARGFGHLQFRQPLTVQLEATGNLRDLATLSATGLVIATDFAIREQWIDSLMATVGYSNRIVEFYHPQLARADGTEQFSADRVTLDIPSQKVFLRGGSGHVSPMAVAAAIGPKTAEAMAPYQFLTIPNATVDGCIPLKHAGDDLVTDDADLTFQVIGSAPFRWRRFETPAITGTIHWRANYLILSNVVAMCYGGPAQGWAAFDVQTPGEGTDFSFYIEGTNVDFNAMGRALWSPTNRLRGMLSGAVTVTSANSADWRTWNGYGQLQLRNGLLWDAPVLGLMSPVLNTLAPGLDIGNSRATEGGGRFTMTNGVIVTDSLEIRSLTMRLDYVGTVDLDENVSARVQSQLLRNTPVVGSFFSLMLTPVSKAFECQVTGTLGEPKITPVYIPFSRVLTAPLHPIRTVERIFSSPSTNAPANP